MTLTGQQLTAQGFGLSAWWVPSIKCLDCEVGILGFLGDHAEKEAMIMTLSSSDRLPPPAAGLHGLRGSVGAFGSVD